MNKRTLFGVALASAIALGACGTPAAPTAQPAAQQPAAATFDWMAYKGKEIRVLIARHPWADNIVPFIPDFEKATGIKVNLEQLPETDMRTKVGIELQGGASSLDVFMTQTGQEGLKYAKAGWYEPLDKFVNDPKMTAPDYDSKDFIPLLVKANTLNGQFVGIPVQYESTTLFYRKDLFDQKGLKPPATLDELMAAAKAFHDPAKDFYGFTARGNGSTAVTQFSPVMYASGADWQDKDGNASLNTPNAVKAFQFWGDILRNYGPPGAVSFGHPEARAIFMQGKAAMYMDASVFVSETEDPTKSQVVGKVGYALAPGGKPYLSPAWAVAIPKASKNKEAAWYFIQYMTTKDKVLATQMKKVAGGRLSAQNNLEAQKAFPADWVTTFNKSIEVGVPYDRPVVVDVPEARNIVGRIIVAAIQGTDVKAAADKAQTEFAELLKKEK